MLLHATALAQTGLIRGHENRMSRLIGGYVTFWEKLSIYGYVRPWVVYFLMLPSYGHIRIYSIY